MTFRTPFPAESAFCDFYLNQLRSASAWGESLDSGSILCSPGMHSSGCVCNIISFGKLRPSPSLCK